MTEDEKRAEQAKYGDDIKGKTLVELAQLMRGLEEDIEAVDTMKSHLQVRYDFLRFGRIPEVMEEQGVRNIAIDGVGKVYLTSDMNVSIKAEHQEQVFEWLQDTGRSAIIKPTVHSSTLKSVVKKILESAEAATLNQSWFNINPFTRAAIKDRTK